MYGTPAKEDMDFTGKYIVWSPSATQPPQMVYTDRPTAIKVCHKMARKFPLQTFTVCKIVGAAAVEGVRYRDLDKE